VLRLLDEPLLLRGPVTVDVARRAHALRIGPRSGLTTECVFERGRL
jgi:hypothetical protein